MSFENTIELNPSLELTDGRFVEIGAAGNFPESLDLSLDLEMSDGTFVEIGAAGSYPLSTELRAALEMSDGTFQSLGTVAIKYGPHHELRIFCRPRWHATDDAFEIMTNGPMAFSQQIYPNSNGNPGHLRIMEYDLGLHEAILIHAVMRGRLN